MKKLSLILVNILLLCAAAFSQQDPIYTQYMFNGLAINPGFTGAHEVISLTAGTRIQWTGTSSEKPVTHTFSAHAPLAIDRGAVGGYVIADKIGNTTRNMVMGSYAYRIPMGLGKLSFGMSAGFTTFQSDPVDAKDMDDPLNQDIGTVTKPQIGAGLFYYTDRFFLGLSAPNLMKYTIEANGATMPYYEYQRHFFAYSGYVIKMSEDLQFKPNVLFKYVDGAPMQLDLNANFLFYEKFGIGASYRSLDAFSIIAEFQLPQPFFRIGYSYDLTHTELFSQQYGTHEIVLNYRFGIKKNILLTPRYF
ncbi:MAG: hypothetical protein CMO01_14980 [Thalassobius sp.]|nr:hypothetical protein [Thalassovita sp.]